MGISLTLLGLRRSHSNGSGRATNTTLVGFAQAFD